MPNVMAAQPNIGGAVCETRQQISDVSGPKFAILWGHVEEISLFNKLFPVVDLSLIHI